MLDSDMMNYCGQLPLHFLSRQLMLIIILRELLARVDP